MQHHLLQRPAAPACCSTSAAARRARPPVAKCCALPPEQQQHRAAEQQPQLQWPCLRAQAARLAAAVVLSTAVCMSSPMAVQPARAATFFDEVHASLAELQLPTSDDQERLRRAISGGLRDMMSTADKLSSSTGRLLSLNAQAARAGELYDGQKVVEVALRMSEDALMLAQEASQLAALEQVPEAEKKLATQIEQAARLVSSIARELAAQQGRAEALGYDLAGPVPASPPSAPAPDAYYSSSTEDRTDPMYWLE